MVKEGEDRDEEEGVGRASTPVRPSLSFREISVLTLSLPARSEISTLESSTSLYTRPLERPTVSLASLSLLHPDIPCNNTAR